jgi:hypothetical protein
MPSARGLPRSGHAKAAMLLRPAGGCSLRTLWNIEGNARSKVDPASAALPRLPGCRYTHNSCESNGMERSPQLRPMHGSGLAVPEASASEAGNTQNRGFTMRYWWFIPAIPGATAIALLLMLSMQNRLPDDDTMETADYRESPVRRDALARGATTPTRAEWYDGRVPVALEENAGSDPAPHQQSLQGKAARRIADLASLYRGEHDAQARTFYASELAVMNDPAAAKHLAALAAEERDPEAFAALLRSLMSSPASQTASDAIVSALVARYRQGDEPDEHIRIQDALGELGPTEASLGLLRQSFADAKADPLERLNAAENLLRIDTRNVSVLPSAEVAGITAQVRLEAQSATDPDIRTQAIMTLAERREENIGFLQQLLTNESDDNVRSLLKDLTS